MLVLVSVMCVCVCVHATEVDKDPVEKVQKMLMTLIEMTALGQLPASEGHVTIGCLRGVGWGPLTLEWQEALEWLYPA